MPREAPAPDDTAPAEATVEQPAAAPAVDRRRTTAALDTELKRYGLDPEQVPTPRLLLPATWFLYPAPAEGDIPTAYRRRTRIRAVLVNGLLVILALALLIGAASTWYAARKLLVEPAEQQRHQAALEQTLDRIVATSTLAIDPVDPQLPDWMWSKFSPDWYIEDAIYSRPLDLADADIETLAFLREKKAVIAREIEPAYSNDKIQNRLRDPDIIYFASDYERAYRRFVSMTLTIALMAREDNRLPGLDAVYGRQRREELVRRITLPKPPEPNAYYDSRVEAMLAQLRTEQPLESSAEGRAQLVEMLDTIQQDIGMTTLQTMAEDGLGPLLRQLPYGWGSTDLTRGFYESKRRRFVDWNILEIRLLMLDLLYRAAELPQELSLVHLYLFHVGGEPYQKLYERVADKQLLADALSWIESDIGQENNPADREQRFVDAFVDNERLTVEGDDPTARRVALALIYNAARFEHTYARVESADDELEARPFLGRMGLPVASIEPDDIKPWGLFKARRNGYSHEGLDIGGELGEPALAVMDGTIVRVGYQRSGAGNYLVLKQGNLEVTYMHLLKEPTRSDYQRFLSREQLQQVGNDAVQGYQLALRRYASLVLGKNQADLTGEELNPSYLRERSLYDRLLAAVRRGETPRVKKGEQIAQVGLSGNVTLNSARPEMIYPHIHLEINDGRVDPMQVIEGIGSRWFEIRDHHLNHPFYRNWLKQDHNWSWYSKFYPSGALPEEARS